MTIDLDEYRPLIAKVARINKHPRVDIEDAISVAISALHRASELFNESNGVKFNTYAIQAMKFEVWKLKPNWNDNEITLNENSLEVITKTNQHTEYRKFLIDLIYSKLSQLDEREQFIITRLYGIDCDEMTQCEVAIELKVVQSRVHFMKERALKKLKNLLADSIS